MAPRPPFLQFLIVGLCVALFGLDLLLPLGVANAVLYAGVVFLAALSPSLRLPVMTAAGCSILTIVGAWLSPSIPEVPLCMVLLNRIISLTAIWTPILFLVQRRHTERLLRNLNESLETRVQSRTAEIAAQEQALRQTQEELRALTSRLLTVQDEERRRVAHDLHDDINQRLAMLSLGLRALEQPEQALPEPVRAALTQSQQDIRLLSEDIRRIAYRFHPSILDDLGLDAALRRLAVLAGDDAMTLPMMAVGGKGVITVTANIAPTEMANMVKAFAAGNIEEARRIHFQLSPLFAALFYETNPIPVKEALGMMGKIDPELRLPLCSMGKENRDKLMQVMKEGRFI